MIVDRQFRRNDNFDIFEDSLKEIILSVYFQLNGFFFCLQLDAINVFSRYQLLLGCTVWNTVLINIRTVGCPSTPTLDRWFEMADPYFTQVANTPDNLASFFAT